MPETMRLYFVLNFTMDGRGCKRATPTMMVFSICRWLCVCVFVSYFHIHAASWCPSTAMAYVFADHFGQICSLYMKHRAEQHISCVPQQFGHQYPWSISTTRQSRSLATFFEGELILNVPLVLCTGPMISKMSQGFANFDHDLFTSWWTYKNTY